MNCNNIVTFENLISVPLGIEYAMLVGQTTFYVAVNTDALQVSSHLGMYEVSNIDNICPDTPLTGDVELYEIRVSGHLNYSISLKCLTSSSNFSINTLNTEKRGCISSNAILPISSSAEDDTTLSYIISNYSGTEPSNIEIKVTLIDISADEPIEVDGNLVALVKGSFEITTNIN